MEFLIISGLSGGGKSMAAGTLEDQGYYCVDNLPVELIVPFASHCLSATGRYEKVLLVSDVRGGQSFDGLFRALDGLDEMGLRYRILFVEAAQEVIIRRYKETRHRHPLQTGDTILRDAVERERTLLAPVRERADLILDTTNLNHAQHRAALLRLLGPQQDKPGMSVTVCSFGYKYGIPSTADLVFDVRFLPNPYYIAELKERTGLDPEIRDFLNSYRQTKDYLARLEDLLAFTLPLYEEEGKTNLVIALGCTGGRHRSVAMAEAVGDFVSKRGYATVIRHPALREQTGEEQI